VSIERISFESKQEFEQLITKEMNQIDKDLTVICNNVSINDKTTLDVLCHDNNGQLVILQLDVNEDDNVLMEGMQSLDYIDKFKSFLKVTYNKNKIDDKQTPRLILIAPRFSDALKHTVEHMQGLRVDLYEWEYLKLGDHKGLRLQPVFAAGQEKHWDMVKEELKEEKTPEKRREQKSKKKESEIEKEEEPKIEPPKPDGDFSEFPLPPEESAEKSKEEKTLFAPEKEEPKRKLRLF